MAASLIAQTLGKYKIVQLLGEGGMATVYKGYQEELDRYAAIKVLPPHPGRSIEFIKRFHREARTIARLHHPHIVTLYEYGTEDDIFYLAMDFIDGGSLTDIIPSHGLPLERVERLLSEITAALDYAHRQEVIHRDIKPGNILLDNEGRAMLADFGIAKQSDDGSTLTGMGNMIGTPMYMAPEQAQGLHVDHRADVYALGALTFELLTGKPPYQGENHVQLLMKHVNAPVPEVSRARSDLPPALNAVMQRVLAKTPDNRYQTATSFYQAFADAIQGMVVPRTHLHDTLLSYKEQLAAETYKIKVKSAPPILTFFFTDIEGSTQLWEQNPKAMSLALAHHDAVMTETIQAYEGSIFKAVGDGVYAVFESPANALEAALIAQQRIYEASLRRGAPLLPLKVRIGLYSGQAEKRSNDYFGTTLNRAARLLSAAHGDQILVSETTQLLLPPETELRDLGIHRLKDVPEPERIYQAVSQSVPPNTAPIRSLTPHPTNLPAQLSSFIGREQDTAEICQLLRQPQTRLLTLLGVGGIGKTRLSIQIGRELLNEYDDGVYFISLAPITQADAVLKAVAQGLDLQEDASTPLLKSIQEHIASRQMLLIFDNFEHVLDAAPLLNELLSAADQVKILATSRESLFIYGEHTYTVAPLRVPAPTEDLPLIQQSPAVRLFVERVRALESEFVLSAANTPTVVKICQQLDGLPLALELAAARIRDLSLDEIAEQLTRRLALLSKGPRGLPSRQQTIRGAITWSYELLMTEEQHVFAQLAVFEGQFFAQAAYAIMGTVDLGSLKRKSLLQDVSAEVFSMLATLREYALERLDESGEATALHKAYADYYCRWLEEAEPHLNGRAQVEWFGHLKVELYNLQAAIAWFLAQQEFENAGRMVAILWRYWAAHSLLSEAQDWLGRVMVHADALSSLIHAKVMQGAGRLALLRADYAEARTLQQQSLTLFRTIADSLGQAAVLQSLGETEYVQGNNEAAEAYLQEGLGLYRQLNNEAGIGRCLNLLGSLVVKSGDFAKAEPLLSESLKLARAHGSAEAVALALYDLGGVLRAQGKYAEAEHHYRESMKIFEELDSSVGVGTMLYNLGFTLQGLLDYAGALRHFLKALTLLQSLDEPVAIAECLIGVAGTFVYFSKRPLAVRTLSAANAILTNLNAEEQLDDVDQAQYQRIYKALHTADIDWQTEWAAGQSMASEAAIREAFQEANLLEIHE